MAKRGFEQLDARAIAGGRRILGRYRHKSGQEIPHLVAAPVDDVAQFTQGIHKSAMGSRYTNMRDALKKASRTGNQCVIVAAAQPLYSIPGGCDDPSVDETPALRPAGGLYPQLDRRSGAEEDSASPHQTLIARGVRRSHDEHETGDEEKDNDRLGRKEKERHGGAPIDREKTGPAEADDKTALNPRLTPASPDPMIGETKTKLFRFPRGPAHVFLPAAL